MLRALFLTLCIFGCLYSSEVPEDWKEYDGLEPEALCGYVEGGLHGDLSELVYILEVYRGRVDRALLKPKDDANKKVVATLARAHASLLSTMQVYNADTAKPKAVRDMDIASLRTSLATIRSAAGPLGVDLPKPEGEPPAVGLPANAKPIQEGQPIQDAGIVTEVKNSLALYDQLLVDGKYREYLKASRRIPDNFEKWDAAEADARAKRETVRVQFAYALAHEADWKLVDNSLVHVPVAVPLHVFPRLKSPRIG